MQPTESTGNSTGVLLQLFNEILLGLGTLNKTVGEVKAEQERLRMVEAEQKEYQLRTHREYGDLISILTKDMPHFTCSPYSLSTTNPVALESHDHLFPLGTKQDNTRYPRFIEKCEAVFGRKIRALDLGCAGGGLVLDFLMAGHQSMGLEGSTCPRVNQLAQWRWLKNRLFTCDITKPFQVTDSAVPGEAQFEIITAWEVLEHIQEAQLPQFFTNIRKHLRSDGYFIASVATFECRDLVSGAVWHVTLKPRAWWEEKCREAGLIPVSGLFETYDFPRGSGNGPHDWDAVTEPEKGFHLVLKAK